MNSFKMNKKLIKTVVTAVVFLILVLFAIAIAKRFIIKKDQEKTIAELKSSVSQIEEENSRISETLQNSEDESYIEQVARDEYSYVKPEERVYYDSDAS